MEHSEGIWGLDRDAVSVVHVNRSDICRWWWWWVRESCATMTRRPTPTFFLVISQTGLHSTKAPTTKAQAAPLPVDQHRPIELFASVQPVQFTSLNLNFCQEKQDVTLGVRKAQKCWPRMQYHSFVAQYFGLVGLAPIFGGLFADGRQ